MVKNQMYLVLEGANTPQVVNFLNRKRSPYVLNIKPEDLKNYMYKVEKYNYVIITTNLNLLTDRTVNFFIKNNYVTLWLVYKFLFFFFFF